VPAVRARLAVRLWWKPKLGEDWGWEACGEREQRALAGLAGGDAVCFEPASEVVGAEMPAGVAAREQPVALPGVAVDFEGERGEGFGEREDAFAELALAGQKYLRASEQPYTTLRR
jgi:hypothetical protein